MGKKRKEREEKLLISFPPPFDAPKLLHWDRVVFMADESVAVSVIAWR